MKVSCLSAIALASAQVARCDLSPTWEKLTYSLTLMEVNLNIDRSRMDNWYNRAAHKGLDGNPLNGTAMAVADELFNRLMYANHMQLRALADLQGYLYWPQDEPNVWYGTDDRDTECVDFRLPEGFLETQGVFDDRDGHRPISDIPGCTTCAADW